MKKILRYIAILCILLYVIDPLAAPPGGGEDGWRECSAFFSVSDPDGNPISGVQVKFTAEIYGSEGNGYKTVYGTTDSYGFVFLSTIVYYEGYEVGHHIWGSIIDGRYSIISSSNTYSNVSYDIDPDFDVILDLDKDNIDDGVETQIAEKFKPVLHKHSHDLQQGLQNFETLLVNGKFTLKVYNDIGQLLYNQVVSGSDNALHKWNLWYWDTYGRGSVSTKESYNLDLNDNYRYTSAPSGQKPIYYHVYKDNNNYYIQYWYYFGMNDISVQTGTWHESDWEHVSIRLIQNGSTFVPDKINFYIHEGGKTYSENQCWWSSNNSLTYSGVQQGYDENHTHLHIWIAANSHASYNRYSQVYKGIFEILGLGIVTHIDRLDYEPTGYNLYFPYDQLIKLGEVTKETYVKCPDSDYSLAFHSYPLGTGSKHWLAYRGKLGHFNHSGSPFIPAKNPSNPSHEWTDFSVSEIFGNTDTYEWVVSMIIQWIDDGGTGD